MLPVAGEVRPSSMVLVVLSLLSTYAELFFQYFWALNLVFSFVELCAPRTPRLCISFVLCAAF